MKLWTIQAADVWLQVQTEGLSVVDAARMRSPDYVPDAYQWLVGQLARRRNWDPNRLPWWCYCAKPDLRAHRHCCVGSQIRLELEVAPERVFVMPCWAWDRVYCEQYLALTKTEEGDWAERMLSAVPLDPDLPDDRLPLWPLPEPWMSELRATWERLFDPRLSTSYWNHEHWIVEGAEAVIQEIRREDVRKAAEFTGVLPTRFRRPRQ